MQVQPETVIIIIQNKNIKNTKLTQHVILAFSSLEDTDWYM